LAVIVFDAEGFKEVSDKSWNDGNTALEIIGRGLANIARISKGDIPARIGGDEFLLIAPFNKTKTTPPALLASLEDRIRHDLPVRFPKMNSLRWHHAVYRHGDTAETLINRAYPKGENKSQMRSHSQSEAEFKRASKAAIESLAFVSGRPILRGA
jgi:GGDEF domain-containing protein